MATSGPGATNLVTPLADAHMDSVPVVAITGQVASAAIGTDAFQEADIRGITMPITKHNYLVTDPAKIPQAIAEAFHIASTGRPGPGARRHQQGRAPGDDDLQLAAADRPARLPPGAAPARQADPRGRRASWPRPSGPILYVGGGVVRARASEALRRLVELTGHPRRHDPHGAGHGARQRAAQPRHARHARHGRRRDGPAEVRPDHRPRGPLRRPRDRPAVDASPRTPRSSTPTSTRPRSPRTAPPTCRSSVTWARSSRTSSSR